MNKVTLGHEAFREVGSFSVSSLINCPSLKQAIIGGPKFIRREGQEWEGLLLDKGVESRPGCPPLVSGELPKFINTLLGTRSI